MLEYEDKPGQIGKIGTVFGDAGINVESMQIAKDSEHPLVEVLINLNQAVPANVRRDLRRRSTSSASGTSTCRGSGNAAGEGQWALCSRPFSRATAGKRGFPRVTRCPMQLFHVFLGSRDTSCTFSTFS